MNEWMNEWFFWTREAWLLFFRQRILKKSQLSACIHCANFFICNWHFKQENWTKVFIQNWLQWKEIRNECVWRQMYEDEFQYNFLLDWRIMIPLSSQDHASWIHCRKCKNNVKSHWLKQVCDVFFLSLSQWEKSGDAMSRKTMIKVF